MGEVGLGRRRLRQAPRSSVRRRSERWAYRFGDCRRVESRSQGSGSCVGRSEGGVRPAEPGPGPVQSVCRGGGPKRFRSREHGPRFRLDAIPVRVHGFPGGCGARHRRPGSADSLPRRDDAVAGDPRPERSGPGLRRSALPSARGDSGRGARDGADAGSRTALNPAAAASPLPGSAGSPGRPGRGPPASDARHPGRASHRPRARR